MVIDEILRVGHKPANAEDKSFVKKVGNTVTDPEGNKRNTLIEIQVAVQSDQLVEHCLSTAAPRIRSTEPPCGMAMAKLLLN